MRGIAPTRQFHSVYQDKEGNHGEGRRRRDSSDREGERKGSEDDDDEEQSHASFDSTDGKTHHLCVFIDSECLFFGVVWFIDGIMCISAL
jgi:hypothetical protein